MCRGKKEHEIVRNCGVAFGEIIENDVEKKVMISLIGVLKAISITANVSGTYDTTHSLPNFSDQNCAKHDGNSTASRCCQEDETHFPMSSQSKDHGILLGEAGHQYFSSPLPQLLCAEVKFLVSAVGSLEVYFFLPTPSLGEQALLSA